MRTRLKIFCIAFYLSCLSSISYGQTSIADSCGLDSEPVLNKYEILFVDSFLFHPYETKKAGKIDPKNGFDFGSKKIAFYSCTINSNTKGKGIISKQKFFDLVKPEGKGHVGFAIIQFTEMEKTKTEGFDAIVLIDCPYNIPDRKQLISKLLAFNK